MASPIKKPMFGGKRKTSASPAPKKELEKYGPVPAKPSGFSMNAPGNREFGFIQNTPKKATASMMGRGMPPLKPSGTRSDSRKQFKAKGKKVF